MLKITPDSFNGLLDKIAEFIQIVDQKFINEPTTPQQTIISIDSNWYNNKSNELRKLYRRREMVLHKLKHLDQHLNQQYEVTKRKLHRDKRNSIH